jgi:hypothetical protein
MDASCVRNFCRRYGLTCRQGLAPSASLQKAEGQDSRSPIHGYVTQRDHNTLHHRLNSETASPKLSMPHGDRAKYCAPAQSGSHAAGFATDRPSPSMLRQRHSTFNIDTVSNAHSGMRASRSPSAKFVFGATQGLSDFEHEAAVRSLSNQTNPYAREECGQHAHDCNINEEKSTNDHLTSRVDGYNLKASVQNWDQEHLNAQEQQQRSLHLSYCSPRNRHCDQVNVPVASMNTSASDVADASCDRLYVVVQRANAALAASGALSKELSEASSFHAIDAKHSLTSATSMESPGSPGRSQLFSQRLCSLVISTNGDIDSSSSIESSPVVKVLTNSGIQSREVFAASSVSDWDGHTGISMNIPKFANTAPILMIRRGGSHSSSGSNHSSRFESLDDLNHSENHKQDSNVCVEQCMRLLQRQKLRSGTDALRPKSAGRDTRKSVRPDLASGLGFKTIETTSRITSDAVRVRRSSRYCLIII